MNVPVPSMAILDHILTGWISTPAGLNAQHGYKAVRLPHHKKEHDMFNWEDTREATPVEKEVAIAAYRLYEQGYVGGAEAREIAVEMAEVAGVSTVTVLKELKLHRRFRNHMALTRRIAIYRKDA